MAVLASDPGGAQICAFFSGVALLLPLVISGAYAARQDEWKLKHWVPAIAILIALGVAIAVFLVKLD
jgi:hypothetical protein